jgi:hypothetical protein
MVEKEEDFNPVIVGKIDVAKDLPEPKFIKMDILKFPIDPGFLKIISDFSEKGKKKESND